MKKTLGFAAALAAVVLAGAPAQAGMEFEGFYAGGSVAAAYDTLEAERKDTGKANDHSDVNVDGRGFVGYGTRIERVYVGAEADIGVDFGEVEYSQTLPAVMGGAEQQVSTTVETDFYAGIDAILGYLVAENTLLYGRVGYEYSPASIEADFGAMGTASVEKDLHGIRGGVGLEVGLTDNISTRIEYRGTFYGEQDITYSSSANPNQRVSESINLDRHVFGLAASYRF